MRENFFLKYTSLASKILYIYSLRGPKAYKQCKTGCDWENSTRACTSLVPVIMGRPGKQGNACLPESGSRFHAMNTC